MNSSDDANTARRNRIAIIGLVVVACGVGLMIYFSLGSPPQMGTNEAVFNTVDALYTAVRNEDGKRVEECARRLRGYRDAGQLPPDAADKLDAVIATAQAGSWRSAAESLHDFMAGQRREGTLEQVPPASEKRGKK